jgi:aminoglycoside phosphotransferase (APT) family kinase protein
MNPALVRQQTGACLSATINWLLDLHAATAQRGASFGPQFERLVERPLNQFKNLLSPTAEEERLIEQTLEVAGPLRDHELPLVCEHGDFSHPNILLVAANRVGVVDWELAEPSGLPMTDLVFFLTYIAFAQQGARRNSEYIEAFQKAFFEPAPWAWSHVIPYSRQLKLSVDMLAPLFVLCWSRYVIGLAMRLHEGEASGEKLNPATAQWLRNNRCYVLWRHAVAQLQPSPKSFQL